MASPKQTLHPIFLKKWMGKIEDPRKLNFFTPPTALVATNIQLAALLHQWSAPSFPY